MIHGLLNVLAPHYCCSCDEIGSILCEGCKYDIVSEPFIGCLLCGSPSLSVCAGCQAIIERSWCGGERSGALEALINKYKFEYAEAAHVPLGDILLATLPDLPSNTVVVPVPTINTHIRQRGYDHTLLVAKYIAKKRDLAVSAALFRKTSAMQRGASRKVRIKQAKEAFGVRGELQESVPYLLVDDVVTTGSTLIYASRALKEAGASQVWAVAAARQPLD